MDPETPKANIKSKQIFKERLFVTSLKTVGLSDRVTYNQQINYFHQQESSIICVH
jgi:hypothetical protein